MKIGIVTDMEGVAGVINSDDWCSPGDLYYEQGKAFLTEEVNAAVDGFFAAGAKEIIVIDGHGAGAINPWLLDERAKVSRGWGVYHQFGLNNGFNALAWVGQHAKAGTLYAHIAHTGSHNVIECKINGISVGEFGQCAAIGGFYGVPSIFGSGDRAFTEEAKTLLPHIHTVAVKEGVNVEDGADFDEESYKRLMAGAVHIHPKCARALIREGAETALKSFIKNPENYPPFRLTPPFIIETWYRKDKNRPSFKITKRHDSDIVAMFAAPSEQG